MNKNMVLAKHLCGNKAITKELYKRFSNAETWAKGEGENSAVLDNTDSKATGENAIAEGTKTRAHGISSHTEGVSTVTNDPNSHSSRIEWSDGYAAHAEGHLTSAGGRASHSEGNNTITNNPSEHAEGQYNVSHYIDNSSYGNAGNTQHSVGIGTNNDTPTEKNRKNAFEIMQNGDIYVIGLGGYDGTNAGTNNVKTLQEIISELIP